MSDITGSAEPDPSRFGSYNVERCVGEGSFARTYLAYKRSDKQKEVPYALKWLREDAESGGARRFENEKWALQHIDHVAFPRYIDSNKERGRPYIVMSFAEGRTVADRVTENIQNRTFFSELVVLLIAEKLLEALVYLDGKQLMHRDIKGENVIVSSSGNEVTLIDLGLCKGPILPVQNETFWNAGAARFAPPAKIENAGASTLSHDLFAVGVLCYRMLTNAYPWQVTDAEGAGDLKNLMLTHQPTAIQEINSIPDNRVCTLVSRMIDVRDYARVPIEEALSKLKEMRTDLETKVFPSISSAPLLRLSRVVRDPVHGDIQMTDLEFAVLNTREMQRLRRIRQLGTTHLVYPGAEHTRLAHAIGVTHVVEKIFRSIELREGFSFTPEERWSARLYALVHDVAHAPFGHTLEDELGFFSRHDRNSDRLDRLFHGANAEFSTILQASEIGRAVVDLMYGTKGPSPLAWIESLLSGSVGADVLDYIDRDSFYCGLDSRVDSAIYRRFTLDRLSTSGKHAKEIIPRLYGNHGLRLDADYAVVSVLEARYSLFLKVYSHPVKTSAGAMIGKALALSAEYAPAAVNEGIVEKMGDDELLSFILKEGPPDAQKLIRRYLGRRLYRPAFRARIMQDSEPNFDNYKNRQEKLRAEGLFDPSSRSTIESELATEAGVAAAELAIYASPKAPGAKTVTQRVEQARGNVTMRDSVFAKHKEIFAQHLGLWTLYLFVNPRLPTDTKARLSSLMRSRFDLVDEPTNDRKQLALNL
ncbi:MAG: uncharacterized protein QOH47_1902 [Sphingomonadales bacterium]|jgi:HD superfamily phosphohydrolase|nr:uncharacterized protein [Sphingomonadales bacterium]